MISFERMQPEYIDALLEIYNGYILTSTATFSIEPIDRVEMEKILFSGLSRYPSFVISEEEEIVGYVLLSRYKPREAYDRTAEVTIYLKPGCMNKGIGSQAVNFIEEFAKDNQFKALLAVICEENVESIRLFEKKGYFKCAHFKEVGVKFDRVLDVVIYEKLI